MYNRRHSCVITPGSVPCFTLPYRQHFNRSETMSVCSDDLAKRAPLSLSARGKMDRQSRGDFMMSGDKAGQSSCSLSSNVSMWSSAVADSSLPPSPMCPPLRRSPVAGASQYYPCSQRCSSMPPSCSSLVKGESVVSMSRIGSLMQRDKEMPPPVSVAPSWWQVPLTTVKASPNSVTSQLRYSPNNKVRSDRAGSYLSAILPKSANTSNSSIGYSFKQHMSRLRSTSDTSTMMQRHRMLAVPSSQLTISDAELDDHVEIVTEEVDPEDSINISVAYKTHERRLVVTIHSLTGMNPRSKCKRNLVVELTLNPGKQWHVVSAPSENSQGYTLPKTVVFEEVRSFSLASRSLSVKVCTKGMIRKTRQVLYQTSMRLTDVSLMGDANWVSLTPVHTKAASFISICMCYQTHKGQLVVTVIKANGLRKSILRKGSYVEVKLLRGCGEKGKIQTVRTKSHSGGRNPVYKEAFSFELPAIGLASCYTELTFTVRRRNPGWTDKVLGRVTLSSEMLLRWKKWQSLENTLDEVFRYPGKVITQCHPLITKKSPINKLQC